MARWSSTCAISLILFTFIFPSSVIGNPAPEQSPSVQADLICHTDNLAECYPKIFQPTLEFQTIHDDQDIPPGLHVRMDIYSGKKEARLNVPREGETEAGYENLPIEKTVVVVPQPEHDDYTEEEEQVALRDQVPQNPPAYEAGGKILPPKPNEASAGDGLMFSQAIKTLGSKDISQESPEEISAALSSLQELSHDIYYGVQIVKDPSLLGNLLLILFYGPDSTTSTTQARYQAAAIIGHAIQNNPKALSEASTSWTHLIETCKGEKKEGTLCEYDTLTSAVLNSLAIETDPLAARSKVYALSGLVKDRAMRDNFLANNGMTFLLKTFIKEGAAWEATRMRIAQFVMDTFLDENMGAELGVWPQEPVIEDAYCGLSEYESRDGCWEFQVRKFGGGEAAEGWVGEFLEALRRVRGGNRGDRLGKEL